MSGSTPAGSPPPEVPEEFAAAYREAYERALAADPDPEPEPEPDTEPDLDLDLREDLGEGTVQTPVPRHASPWLVPVLLVLLALLLVIGAYTVGRRFAGQVGDDVAPDAGPGLVLGAGAGGGKQPVTNQRPGSGAWAGKVVPLGGVRAKARCTSGAGVDARGEKVSYDAGNLTDGVVESTWRCDGSAIGEKITLDLAKAVPVAEVGLIPGYAKTDAKSRADRFAENNRVTRLRWRIGGTEVVQELSGRPDDRSLQLVRVPRTTTDTVELQILAVRKGPRDTTAISEIRLARAAG